MARAFVWIGAALLVVLLSLVGSYLYYQQLASAAVAQFSRQLPDGLQLVYESVSADTGGRIEIQNASLLPAAGVGGARVERIVLHTPGFSYLLTAEKQLQSGLLPMSGRIELKGLNLPLSPVNIPLIDSLVSASLADSEALPVILMACGGHDPLSLQQLYEMGVAELRSDLNIHYQHAMQERMLRAELEYAADKLFSVRGSVQIMSDAPAPSPRMFEHYAGWLQQADFSFQDQGYHQQRNLYCASLDDDILDQYLKFHRERVAANLRDLGWQISPEMAYAYQRVMSPRGDFELQIKPQRALMMTEFKQLSLDADWHRLSPRIRLGSEWLALNELYQAPEQETLIATIQHQLQTEAPGAGKDEDEQRRRTREAIQRAVQGGHHAEREKAYQPVEVVRITEFVGHWVRLETYFGRQVHGTLERIEGNMLYVDQHMQQGSAIYPIDKTKLARLEVLH